MDFLQAARKDQGNRAPVSALSLRLSGRTLPLDVAAS
jgi:hypothetical protein